jgi:AmmeMemoRadiSam system protein B
VQPKLRELKAQPTVHQGQQGIVLSDPLGLGQAAIFIPQPLAPLLILMDGTRDVGTLRTGFELRTGMPLTKLNLEELVRALDEALLMDNERFAHALEAAVSEYRSAPYRPYTLPGRMCPSDPEELSTYLQQYLDQVEDADPCSADEVKGLISPHIDFPRGGPIYASVWAGAAAAANEAELVVILGTDHNAAEAGITLTRQSYQTPWGTIPTPKDLVDEIADAAGDDVFRYELHHRGEHSIETAALWLHYLIGDKPCPMLPVLCSSFQALIDSGESPSAVPPISAAAEVLKTTARHRRTMFVAAADLAHVGPAFGDSAPLDVLAKTDLGQRDRALIDTLSHAEADDFYGAIRAEGDRRRICGMPPIYLMLSVLSQVEGSLAGYAQCPASEDGGSVVSICGMVYRSKTT